MILPPFITNFTRCNSVMIAGDRDDVGILAALEGTEHALGRRNVCTTMAAVKAAAAAHPSGSGLVARRRCVISFNRRAIVITSLEK